MPKQPHSRPVKRPKPPQGGSGIPRRSSLQVDISKSQWEVEALRKQVEDLKDQLQVYDELAELHRACLHRASVYWQKKTGRQDVWPDVTELLIWLMDQIEDKTN